MLIVLIVLSLAGGCITIPHKDDAHPVALLCIGVAMILIAFTLALMSHHLMVWAGASAAGLGIGLLTLLAK